MVSQKVGGAPAITKAGICEQVRFDLYDGNCQVCLRDSSGKGYVLSIGGNGINLYDEWYEKWLWQDH